MEKVRTYKYLGCIIQENLKWDTHSTSQISKCSERLFLLRQLNKLNVDRKILCLYYNAMISNVATYVIGSWHNNGGTNVLRQLAQIDKNKLKIDKKAGTPSNAHTAAVYRRSSTASTKNIMTDAQHPLHDYFKWLPSERRLYFPYCRTNRHKNTAVPSFIKIFNEKAISNQ